MKTIIMAGGKGTRISELFSDIPKPLIPIENTPVLEREDNLLTKSGIYGSYSNRIAHWRIKLFLILVMVLN